MIGQEAISAVKRIRALRIEVNRELETLRPNFANVRRSLPDASLPYTESALTEAVRQLKNAEDQMQGLAGRLLAQEALER